ncbi:hypothetical protein NBRC111894_265 [Sporolactobacillus inulinus]|uniref:Uncharacterized protein n=1 Tax=Sporolactobacillus inulinus TaxID=2078 RepID=A0A4Y1Z727_9BACL|nr:hypothetical protein NBRC111894_265 [Sporolactobacillus inulinus]
MCFFRADRYLFPIVFLFALLLLGYFDDYDATAFDLFMDAL